MNSANNFKYILALETTSKVCSAALLMNNKKIYSDSTITNNLHSVILFEMLDKLFNKCNVSMKDIDLIRVSSGPGSFTGIRIGISTALGLSKAYDTSIQYVDTLDSFIYDINDCDLILSMIDAKCNRVYFSLYNGKTHKKLIDDTAIDVQDLLSLLNKNFSTKNVSIKIVGDGALKYKDFFLNNKNLSFVLAENKCVFTAVSLLFTKGKKTYKPFVNYVLKSKAEREYIDKH